MGEAVNIRIADVIMHSHSAFIARPTTDAHFLISCPHFLLPPILTNLETGKENYTSLTICQLTGKQARGCTVKHHRLRDWSHSPSLPPSSPLCCQTEAH